MQINTERYDLRDSAQAVILIVFTIGNDAEKHRTKREDRSWSGSVLHVAR